MFVNVDVFPGAPLALTRLQAGVIIPVYNRASVILATLDSVARQTRLPAKLIIIDDGSTDGSLESVERWIAQVQPEFETAVTRQQHKRAAAARNRGMQVLADLPLVAFLDSDDHWPNDFLARTIGALEQHTNAVAATVDRRFIDAWGTVFRRDDCRILVRDPITWIFRHGGGIASSTLFRTDAVIAAGGWNDAMDASEDSMLFSHVALQGEWIHAAGDPVELQHGNAAMCNEEGNASFRYADSFRRFAHEYESIYRSLVDRVTEPQRRRLRSGLAVFWYRAGKQLDRLGDRKAALQCYARAIEWKPVFFRAWRRRCVPFGLRTLRKS